MNKDHTINSEIAMDGRKPAKKTIGHFFPLFVTIEGIFDVGLDSCFWVDDSHEIPFNPTRAKQISQLPPAHEALLHIDHSDGRAGFRHTLQNKFQ